ncbi:unnamed protein product [Paramecium primaurelia]|uniref:Uncharacterized protein n=1 Tax=Paramecium primaurelia TaxID=5886 RepID=A0A8S1PG67_PARPR|nr:unnamed protein product [Paramecium primaurelia]
MKIYGIKQEERTNPGPISIPRSIPFYQTSENLISIQKQWTVIHKFMRALNKLQLAQNKIHNQPKYPFVLQLSMNEFMVHLGSDKLELRMSNELSFYPNYGPVQYCCPPPVSSPTPTIKLPIHKKREVNVLQDQKDTKNIPKNYCKSIITFACKNQNLCLEILKDQLKVIKFLEKITVFKKQLLNIRIFSSLLQHSDDPEEEEFRKAFRIISRIFIKKYAINYIFNSKIVQHNWHMRYRSQIYKGVKNPNNFSHIKNL